MLVAITADPERSLSSVDVLGEGELARLDGLGNRAALGRPRPRESIAAMFAAQAAGTPDSVAVTCGAAQSPTASWTRRPTGWPICWPARVWRRACGADASRSAEAIAAILAVLKTGAAYLPMDPAVPAARMEFMLADAAPIAAITTADLATRLDGHGLLVIDVEDPAVDTQPSTPLPAPAPDDIAYLIYTSGTTGVPKGVAVTQRNVTQLMDVVGPVLRGDMAAVSFVGLRRVGVGDLRSAASRWPGGGGAGRGGGLTGRLSRDADCRAGQRVDPDAVGGGDALTRGFGVGGVGRGRRGLPA